MQLCRSSAQQGGGIKIGAYMLAGKCCLAGRAQLQESGWSVRDGAQGKVLGGAGFVIAVQLFECPLPPIALVADQALQHGQSRRFLPFAAVFDRPSEGCNMSEMCRFGDISPDLRVWVGARLLS